eukprot:g241.t1
MTNFPAFMPMCSFVSGNDYVDTSCVWFSSPKFFYGFLIVLFGFLAVSWLGDFSTFVKKGACGMIFALVSFAKPTILVNLLCILALLYYQGLANIFDKRTRVLQILQSSKCWLEDFLKVILWSSTGLSYVATQLKHERVAMSTLFFLGQPFDLERKFLIVLSLAVFGAFITSIQQFVNQFTKACEKWNQDDSAVGNKGIFVRLVAKCSLELRVCCALVVATFALAHGTTLAKSFVRDVVESGSLDNSARPSWQSWQWHLVAELATWSAAMCLFMCLLDPLLSISAIVFNKIHILKCCPVLESEGDEDEIEECSDGEEEIGGGGGVKATEKGSKKRLKRGPTVKTLKVQHPVVTYSKTKGWGGTIPNTFQNLDTLIGANQVINNLLENHGRRYFGDKFEEKKGVLFVLFFLYVIMSSTKQALIDIVELGRGDWFWKCLVEMEFMNESETDVIWEKTLVDVRSKWKSETIRPDGRMTAKLVFPKDPMLTIELSSSSKSNKHICIVPDKDKNEGNARTKLEVAVTVPKRSKKHWHQFLKSLFEVEEADEEDEILEKTKESVIDKLTQALGVKELPRKFKAFRKLLGNDVNPNNAMKRMVDFVREKIDRAIDMHQDKLGALWDVAIVVDTTKNKDVKLRMPLMTGNKSIFDSSEKAFKKKDGKASAVEEDASDDKDSHVSLGGGSTKVCEGEDEDDMSDDDDDDDDDLFKAFKKSLFSVGPFEKFHRRAFRKRESKIRDFVSQMRGVIQETVLVPNLKNITSFGKTAYEFCVEMAEMTKDDQVPEGVLAAIEHLFWFFVLDLVQNSVGRAEYRRSLEEQKRKNERSGIASKGESVSWEHLNDEERLDYFQRSTIKYAVRFVDYVLVEFMKKSLYRKLLNLVQTSLKSSVGEILRLQRQWKKDNDVAEWYKTFFTDGLVEERVEKEGKFGKDMDFGDILKKVGVRKNRFCDLCFIASEDLREHNICENDIDSFLSQVKLCVVEEKKWNDSVLSSSERNRLDDIKCEKKLADLGQLPADKLVNEVLGFSIGCESALDSTKLHQLKEFDNDRFECIGLKKVQVRIIRRALEMLDITVDRALLASQANDPASFWKELGVPFDALNRPCRNLQDIESFAFNGSCFQKAFVQSHSDLEAVFLQAKKLLRRRRRLQTCQTVGRMCDLLQLETTRPSRPLTDLWRCRTRKDLASKLEGEIHDFKGEETTILGLLKRVRERRLAAKKASSTLFSTRKKSPSKTHTEDTKSKHAIRCVEAVPIPYTEASAPAVEMSASDSDDDGDDIPMAEIDDDDIPIAEADE